MLKSPSKNFLSKLNYEDIESFFDYESTLTYYQESQDPWDVFYGKQNSSPSEETQPTESSSKETSKSNPAHYKRGTIEIWDFIVDQELDYLAGNCVKYICRAGHKSGESELDDWLKVHAYVNRKLQQLHQQ